jgi:methionyl-tRNA formyltransferase
MQTMKIVLAGSPGFADCCQTRFVADEMISEVFVVFTSLLKQVEVRQKGYVSSRDSLCFAEGK